MATLEELARLYQASRMSGGNWPMVTGGVGPGEFTPPRNAGSAEWQRLNAWRASQGLPQLPPPDPAMMRPGYGGPQPSPNEMVDAIRFTGNMPLGNRPTAMDFGAPYLPPPAGGWGGGQPPRPPGPAPRPGPQPMPPPRPMPPAAIPPSMNQPAPMSWWQRNAALQREGPGGAYLDPEAAARALASRG